MKQNLFPIFNPINNKFINYKDRFYVHKDGDWHMAVQANIIRKNKNGTYDILIQERSSKVDISFNKLDQSLATQMCLFDSFSPELTLKRGLLSELGITNYEFKRFPNNMYIVKTYQNQKEIINRELLYLYIVKIDKSNIKPITSKIKKIFWMEWKDFIIFFNKNKERFTKTSQFYFSNKRILKNIEKLQDSFFDFRKNKISNDNHCIFYIHNSNGKKKYFFFKKDNKSNFNYLFK